MSYDTKTVMLEAWSLHRKGVETFALALSLAWANAKTRQEAKESAGITEPTNTWAGWRDQGLEVKHESRCLYRAILHDPTTRNGTRVHCFFGTSQVQPVTS